jgi:hypothetical protein
MRTTLFSLVTLLGVLLGGCDQERHQAAIYDGKADTAPWDSPQWGGAQTAWERAIRDRTANQNEYSRMPLVRYPAPIAATKSFDGAALCA